MLNENSTSLSSTHLYKQVWTLIYFLYVGKIVVMTATPSSFSFLRSALRFDDTSCSIVWKCLDDHSRSSLPRTPLICSEPQHTFTLYMLCCTRFLFFTSSSALHHFLFQKFAADKSRVYRRWREAHGAVAFHGLGEPQALSAAVQASRG